MNITDNWKTLIEESLLFIEIFYIENNGFKKMEQVGTLSVKAS